MCVCVCVQGHPNNITIEYLCSFMANESLGPSLERFLQLYQTLTKGAPINVDYNAMIQSMREDSWNSSTAQFGGVCVHVCDIHYSLVAILLSVVCVCVCVWLLTAFRGLLYNKVKFLGSLNMEDEFNFLSTPHQHSL